MLNDVYPPLKEDKVLKKGEVRELNNNDKEKHFEKVIENERTKWNEEDRNKLDEFKEQQLVDDIPLEDLKIEQEDERKKHKTKDDSQSERKYK